MAFDKDAFLTALDSMTVLELNDLVKAIEEKFGVSAASMAAPAAGGAAGGAAAAAEEKTEFNVDQVLGFLQAQAGDFTHGLDDANLVRAGALQRHGEFGLLFSGSSATSSSRTGHGHGSSRHAKLLFERLDQVVQFHHGHRANGFQDVVFGDCHLNNSRM